MNDNVMVRDIGTLQKPVLMKAFAHKGARDFDDGYWLRLIHDGSTKKRLEYCQDEDGNLSFFRAIQGHSASIPTSPVWMKYTPIPYDWKKYLYHIGSQWVIPGVKEDDKARQAVFLTGLNPFRRDPGEEKPHSNYTVPQRDPCGAEWERNQDAVCWVRLNEAQDQGLQFWQTKSFAIMTDFTILRDCVDRVTAKNGDRVLFERLATPRPAPKVTLKRNWHSQPQQPISHTDVLSVWKQRQKCKTTRNTLQKRTKHWENQEQFTSQMSVNTHHSNQVTKKSAQMHS